MEITLTGRWERFVRERVEDGHYQAPEDVIEDACAALAEKEAEKSAKLRAELDEARDEIDRGECYELETEEDIRKFFDDIVRRGHERLDEERKCQAS